MSDSTQQRTLLGVAHSDRKNMSKERMVLIAVLISVQVWAALGSLPRGNSPGRTFTVEAAVVVALLAVFGLRSLPIRWIIRGIGIFTALLLGRFGELGHEGGFAGSWKILVWIGALGFALILAPSSRSIPGESDGQLRMLQRMHSAAVRRYSPLQAVVAVAVIAVVLGATLLVGPRMAQQYPLGSSAADVIDGIDRRSNNSLLATDRLDMTTRPRLSDQVVMSVRSPVRAFWRSEIFDVWDGSSWTRSEPFAGRPMVNGVLEPPPDDLSGLYGLPFETEFRFEVGFATAVPHAPSAVQIDTQDDLIQRVDGTLVSPFQPLGRNTTYAVTSRQLPVNEPLLRSVSAIDVVEDYPGILTSLASQLLRSDNDEPVLADAQLSNSVLNQYSQEPYATERVRELAHTVVAGLDNDYDRVRALEAWMDVNTEYSLDAPLAPRGVDVVDDFLFESQLGWCEQIASALVVLAREVGIPARLVTGFTDGDWDPVSGRFTVREHHAHAWAEVWFPQAGWIAFDPTADVPLAGDAASAVGAAASDWREVAGAVLAVGGLGSLILVLLGRHISRWAGAIERYLYLRRRQMKFWWVKEEVAIERLGKRAGIVREPHETLRQYSQRVVTVTGDTTLFDQVDNIELARFGAPSPIET